MSRFNDAAIDVPGEAGFWSVKIMMPAHWPIPAAASRPVRALPRGTGSDSPTGGSSPASRVPRSP